MQFAIDVDYVTTPVECVACDELITGEEVRLINIINKTKKLSYHQECFHDLAYSLQYFEKHYAVNKELVGGVN